MKPCEAKLRHIRRFSWTHNSRGCISLDASDFTAACKFDIIIAAGIPLPQTSAMQTAMIERIIEVDPPALLAAQCI